MTETVEKFLDLRSKLTHPLKVAEKIQETPDAYSFRFEIPSELSEKFQYEAGQFVTLFLSVDDQHIRRSYSLSTSPALDSHFQVTVKQVKGGLGSNYLADKVHVGDEVFVTPPAGSFYQPLAANQNAQYFFFAAGSGITPVFSILKETLSHDPTAQAYLLFANRDEEHIIYRQTLEDIVDKFSGRLFVTHQLSKPQNAYPESGRCDEAKARDFITTYKKGDLVQSYICGPDGFMTAAKEALDNCGFSSDQIRTESFTTALTQAENTPSSQPSDDLDGIVIGDPSSLTSAPSKIGVLLNGERLEVEVDPEISILESLINAGQNPPYSCMDGACMACMAKVTSGKVVQDDYGILTEENIEAGEALTCKAKPASDNLVIDFDDI